MSKVYDVDFLEMQGKVIVIFLMSFILARIGVGSFVKMILVVGLVVGGIMVFVFVGVFIYVFGQVFKWYYELGGIILDFDFV